MKVLVRDSVAEIDEDVFAGLSGVNGPAFDADTDVAHEEIFGIDPTAPGMISLEVAVTLPIVSCKHIRAPKRNVKLSVCVPLRTRWRSSYLLQFFARVTN